MVRLFHLAFRISRSRSPFMQLLLILPVMMKLMMKFMLLAMMLDWADIFKRLCVPTLPRQREALHCFGIFAKVAFQALDRERVRLGAFV